MRHDLDIVLELEDKIEGLETDLEYTVEVAFNFGSYDWVRLNYPALFQRFCEKDYEYIKCFMPKETVK